MGKDVKLNLLILYVRQSLFGTRNTLYKLISMEHDRTSMLVPMECCSRGSRGEFIMDEERRRWRERQVVMPRKHDFYSLF